MYADESEPQLLLPPPSSIGPLPDTGEREAGDGPAATEDLVLSALEELNTPLPIDAQQLGGALSKFEEGLKQHDATPHVIDAIRDVK